MTEGSPTSSTLMYRHVEALYTHDVRGRIQRINQWDGGRVPRFHLGRTSAGHVWRLRTDLADDVAAELESLCRLEPLLAEPPPVPVLRLEYVRVLSRDAPVERIWTGPCYWFPEWLPERVVPATAPVVVDEANASLLNGGFEAWLGDVPHRSPFMAVVGDGHAVAVCASVRVTGAAHEAGVETLPAYRRKGHAANVVAAWAARVQEAGAVPLYSTSWDNQASQRVAARLGLPMFGVDFHVT